MNVASPHIDQSCSEATLLSPPRILLIDLSRKFGGTDVRVQSLLSGLQSEFEIHLAVLSGSEFARRLSPSGATVWPIDVHPKDPRCIRLLADLIDKIRPDLVDSQNPQSTLWGLTAARLMKIRNRVATVHSVYEESETGILRSHIYKAFPRLLDALAIRAIAVSDNVRDNLIHRGLPESKVDVIRNGIPITVNAGAVKSKPSTGEMFRIAVVGRLIPVKGHKYLIEAMRRLREQVPHSSCVFIGDGSERAELEALCQETRTSDIVEFAGYRNNVDEIVGQCDVFCLPSLTEGLPFAVLEASQLNVPIIASRVGGLQRHFVHGETARLTRPGDSEDLYAELVWCAAHPVESFEMAIRARDMIDREFSHDVMLKQTVDTYRGLIQAQRSE